MIHQTCIYKLVLCTNVPPELKLSQRQVDVVRFGKSEIFTLIENKSERRRPFFDYPNDWSMAVVRNGNWLGLDLPEIVQSYKWRNKCRRNAKVKSRRHTLTRTSRHANIENTNNIHKIYLQNLTVKHGHSVCLR